MEVKDEILPHPQTGEGVEEEEEEEDLDNLRAEIARMEEEAARITRQTEELNKINNESSGNDGNGNDKVSRDGHSVYVGQVDYSATPEEVLKHFEACGTVQRVTIVCDKHTGQPKGFAYIEFETEEAVENAFKLDGSEFKGRQLKVTHKRVNQPGFSGGGRGRGRFGGGRGGYGGGRGGGYRGGFRGRGRGRGGRGGAYHPYY